MESGSAVGARRVDVDFVVEQLPDGGDIALHRGVGKPRIGRPRVRAERREDEDEGGCWQIADASHNGHILLPDETIVGSCGA